MLLACDQSVGERGDKGLVAWLLTTEASQNVLLPSWSCGCPGSKVVFKRYE